MNIFSHGCQTFSHVSGTLNTGNPGKHLVMIKIYSVISNRFVSIYILVFDMILTIKSFQQYFSFVPFTP